MSGGSRGEFERGGYTVYGLRLNTAVRFYVAHARRRFRKAVSNYRDYSSFYPARGGGSRYIDGATDRA